MPSKCAHGQPGGCLNCFTPEMEKRVLEAIELARPANELVQSLLDTPCPSCSQGICVGDKFCSQCGAFVGLLGSQQ